MHHPELDLAFTSLFDDPNQGWMLLGKVGKEGLGNLGLKTAKDISSSVEINFRIACYKRLLLNWITLKGKEIEEYGDPESIARIKADAIATILAFREVQRFFPEIEIATLEQLNLVNG